MVISAALLFAAVRIAFGIVLDAAALIVWDVGTRSPQRLFADVRAGIRHAPAVAGGVVRALTGIAAVVTAGIVIGPVTNSSFDFRAIEVSALLCALVIEQLVGPSLRARSRARRSRPPTS